MGLEEMWNGLFHRFQSFCKLPFLARRSHFFKVKVKFERTAHAQFKAGNLKLNNGGKFKFFTILGGAKAPWPPPRSAPVTNDRIKYLPHSA